MDDFTKYRRMRDEGADAATVLRCAIDDGVDLITRVRMLRAVFALDLHDAKEVMLAVEGVTANDFIAPLQKALDDLDDDEDE
jgi:hypothetical protein